MPEMLACRITLPPPLHRLLHAEARGRLEREVATAIGSRAAALGLDTGVVCRAEPGAATRARTQDDVLLHIGARRCRFAREQQLRAWSHAWGQPLGSEASRADANWLAAAPDPVVTRFVAGLAVQGVTADPTALLADRSAARSARAAFVERALLAQGISVAGLSTDPDLVAQVEDASLDIESAAEAAIATLKPGRIEIHLRRDDLQALTTAASPAERDRFKLLRDGLYYECGLRVPALQFVENDSLDAGEFAVKINDVLGLPWVGLNLDERLVNAAPQDVGSWHDGPRRPLMNPGTGAQYTAVPSAAELQARTRGLTIWSPLEYLVLCASVDLQRLAPRLLDQGSVDEELDRLALYAPALVRCARERIDRPHLVAVLRQLAAEGLSLLHLRGLLAALVDARVLVADRSDSIVVDERIIVSAAVPEPLSVDLLTAAARKSQRVPITQAAQNPSGAIEAILIDPAIGERARAESGGATLEHAPWHDRLLDRLGARARTGGLRPGGPCVLTDADSRAALRRIVAQELPQLSVLSFDELSPDVRLSVAERIVASELSDDDVSGGA